MEKLVDFIINDGNFNEGFYVSLEIREKGIPILLKPYTKVPPAPEIPKLYQNWQKQYTFWISVQRGIEVPQNQVTNVSSQQDCKEAERKLKKCMEEWFKQPSFVELGKKVLDTVKEEESAHIIFKINNDLIHQKNNELLQKLPWQLWNIFDSRNKVWFSLSSKTEQHSQQKIKAVMLKMPVKILAIFGADEGINIQKDKLFLEELQSKKKAEIEKLLQPTLEEVHNKLWNDSWDILFFAGHSYSQNDGNSGNIQINRNESLNLDDFRNTLREATKKGLKLAIFNSCDGMGLANKLAELEIPQVIVMREPVPDEVAQKFLQEFLRLFSEGEPFYLAVRQAANKLESVGGKYPGALWLPVICQNPTEKSLAWSQPNRFQYIVKNIITRIHQFWQLHKRTILFFTLIIIGLLSNLFIHKLITSQTSKPDMANIFSRGEKVLITWNNDKKREEAELEKEKGTKEFDSKHFDKAIKHFQNSRRISKNDPENLIYLNNAQIGENLSYTIAVPVPIGKNKKGAEEILRGVAQAQDEINSTQGINGKLLQVLIADDDNNDNYLAPQVAKKLVDDPNVISVVGHYTSNVALKVAKVYEDNKLVVIFPVSTSVNLSGFGNYVFRTVPSDACAAKVLADFMLNRFTQPKADVFYNSQSEYSKSLKSEFEKAILEKQGEKPISFNLQEPLDSSPRFQSSIKNKANVLALFPDTEKLKDALEILKENRSQGLDVLVLGGDDVYDNMTLNFGGADAKGMIVAVPWHIKSDPLSDFKKEFVKKSEELWGGDVNWRTVTSYDATKALIAAIQQKQNPTREEVSQALRSKNFTSQGVISGAVKFSRGDRRNASIQLVKVTYFGSSSRSGFDYDFTPVGPPKLCQFN